LGTNETTTTMQTTPSRPQFLQVDSLEEILSKSWEDEEESRQIGTNETTTTMQTTPSRPQFLQVDSLEEILSKSWEDGEESRQMGTNETTTTTQTNHIFFKYKRDNLSFGLCKLIRI
jgi:hypothetical protein